MLRIANVSLPLDFSERDLLAIAAHKLRVPVSSIHSVSIARRSVDARDKRDVHFVASLDIDVLHEDALLKKSKGTMIRTPQAFQPELPICALPYRPLIVGAGPSGIGHRPRCRIILVTVVGELEHEVIPHAVRRLCFDECGREKRNLSQDLAFLFILDGRIFAGAPLQA